MRFLVRIVATKVPQESLLDSVRTIARSLGAEARNPKWTSYDSLEIDIFCPTKSDFDLFLSAITPIANLEFTKDLNQAPPHREEAELFSEARALFNAERYWECHEVLEGIWRMKQGEDKRLLQGIILVCAAFVHHQKREETVALSVLKRGSNQLEYSEPEYGGFRIPDLIRNVEKVLQSGEFSNFQV